MLLESDADDKDDEDDEDEEMNGMKETNERELNRGERNAEGKVLHRD